MGAHCAPPSRRDAPFRRKCVRLQINANCRIIFTAISWCRFIDEQKKDEKDVVAHSPIGRARGYPSGTDLTDAIC